MIRFIHNNRNYFLPENYNELTGKQLLQIAALQRKEGDHGLRVLKILLAINLYKFFRVPLDAKNEMLQYIDWVFQQKDFTKQIIPFYKGFCAPKSEFDNLTLGEFHFTEMFYKRVVNGDASAADKLIAVLYRKPKKDYDFARDVDGDARVEFNGNEIDYWARKVKRWNITVKTAIVMWYGGCREYLIELFPDIFEAPGSEDAMEDSLGMYNLIRNLSGKRFGLIKDVEKVTVHTACVEIEQMIKENEEAEKQIKSMSK